MENKPIDKTTYDSSVKTKIVSEQQTELYM